MLPIRANFSCSELPLLLLLPPLLLLLLLRTR
jgi:hypothetical protein